MGLVKYGQQTLNIAEIPDGHMVISESDFNSLRGSQNAYLSLKSKIPVGIDESQLSALVEKGSRFDTVNTELSNMKGEKTQLQQKLDGFKNIPEGFSPEKWNKFVQRETAEVRQGKLDKLTAKVYEKVKEVTKQDMTVDPRFIDQEKLSSFDPDSPTAFDDYYKILDAAHTAQQDFVQKSVGNAPPPTVGVGAVPPGAKNQQPYQNPGKADSVNPNSAVQVGGFFNQ